MFDLHLHSRWSDGDLSVAALVARAKACGVAGISLTDHNGLWGVAEAAARAVQAGLAFVPGIEITARADAADVHILGYARNFNEAVLRAGLASTRQGYEQRVRRMVERCHAAGYSNIAWDDIVQQRSRQTDPCYVSYDVARRLTARHQLSVDDARRLTVRGGACFEPYGDWALTPSAAVQLLRAAGGISVLAHPGTIIHEAGTDVLRTIVAEMVAAGLDGLEVYHPFHSSEVTSDLAALAAHHHLLVTGGSDWHGAERVNAAALGQVGIGAEQFALLGSRLDAL